MLGLDFESWVLAKRRNLDSSNIKKVPQHYIETRLGDPGKKFPFDKDWSLDGLGPADLVAEHGINRPSYPIAVVRQFIDLPMILLFVRAHTSQNYDLFYN